LKQVRNEVLVQEALSRLVEHKTLIVIAHRMSSVVAADQILVLDKGRIIERGTHTDLLSHDGLYASMWNEQQQVKSWQFKQ
jgi:ATP-binding cassette subfamily B protein